MDVARLIKSKIILNDNKIIPSLTNFKLTSLVFVLACYHSLAQQGNYKFNNFGNRTILLAGNVTGSVEDFGLAYYNPARLTEIENNRFAFNARAYEYSSITLEDVIDENVTPRDSKFNTIPSMAAGTFSLLGTRFAYSIFTKYATNTNLNYRSDLVEKDLIEELSGTENYIMEFRINSLLRERLIGLTWAQAVNDNLSLGVSVFGSIYRNGGDSNLEYTIKAEDNRVAYFQNRPQFRQDSYGIFVKIGASYHFPKFDLGINLNLPYMEISGKGRYDYQRVIAGIAPDSDELYSYKLRDLEAKRLEPFGVSIGAGIPIAKNKLHLNLDYVAGLSSYTRIKVPEFDTGQDEITSVSFDESRKEVLNFGLGAEIFVNERIDLYAGFSTDFNALTTSSNILDVSGTTANKSDLGNDYIHTSFGTELQLKWASLILGATHTRSTTDFFSPFKLQSDEIDLSDSTFSVLSFIRWQFIVGLDIPFLNKQAKKIQKNKSDD